MASQMSARARLSSLTTSSIIKIKARSKAPLKQPPLAVPTFPTGTGRPLRTVATRPAYGLSGSRTATSFGALRTTIA